jgi:hypothetical protein
VSRIRRRVRTRTDTPDGTVRIFFTYCVNASSEPEATRPPEGTSPEMAHLPEPSPVETSGLTRRPLRKRSNQAYAPRNNSKPHYLRLRPRNPASATSALRLSMAGRSRIDRHRLRSRR